MNDVLERTGITGLTSYQLKLIAIVTMAIDHIGLLFFSESLEFRYIGRLSFPIFCFLLVEGFHHTHDVFRYMCRLAAFSIIAEIPYDLAFHGSILEFTRQNVFLSLLIGIGMLYFVERTSLWPEKILIVLLAMWLANGIHSEYGYKGIMLIFAFYVFREYYWVKLAAGAFWNLLWGMIQRWGVLAMIPIALYNGKQGRKMQYFFYAFYPLHLLVLYLIQIFR